MISNFSAKYGMLRSLVIYRWLPGRRRTLTNFYSQFIKPGDICFDLGAHVGSRTRVWSDLGAKVIAFEPQNLFFQYLRKEFANNSMVVIEKKAIGNHNGKVKLMVSDKTPTVSTVDPQWISDVKVDKRFSKIDWNRKENVVMITLDKAISQYGMPTFIKIDVEGFEEDVISGLSTKVPCVSFEYIPVTKDRAIRCIQHLERLDRYCYNWSQTESMHLESSQWLSAKLMISILSKLKIADRSGDIYAKQAR